jgi:hypothetical protein
MKKLILILLLITPTFCFAETYYISKSKIGVLEKLIESNNYVVVEMDTYGKKSDEEEKLIKEANKVYIVENSKIYLFFDKSTAKKICKNDNVIELAKKDKASSVQEFEKVCGIN